MEESSNTIKYIWRLENFSFCDFYSNRQLKSPSFELHEPVPSKWYLYMFPNGCGIDKHVSIFLKRSKKDIGPREICVQFKISLLDTDGNLCPEAPSMEKVFTKDCEWGHNEFIKRSELSTGCPFLYQDILTVLCQITIIDQSFPGRLPRRSMSLQPGISEEKKAVCRAIESMYEDTLHNDMILESKHKTFKVHKCILTARLPGLLHKLEKKPDTVFSDDCLTEKILQYAYCGKFVMKGINPFIVRSSLTEYGQLHMEKDLMPQSDEYSALTYFGVQKFVYSWKILTSLLSEENEIFSPFILDQFEDNGFFVYLAKKESGEWSVNITALKSSNDDIFARCNILMRDLTRSVSDTCEHLYRSDVCWESPFTLRLEDDTLTFNDQPHFLSGDFFYLDFVFIYPSGKFESSIQQVTTDYTSFKYCNIDDTEKLLLDLEELYYDQRESDTTICAGEREFKVHKCILCARSPCFRAMFTHDMIEKKNNKVKLKNDRLDAHTFAKVVDKLLLFTYCGKFEAGSPVFASHLLDAIEMYMIGEDYEDM